MRGGDLIERLYTSNAAMRITRYTGTQWPFRVNEKALNFFTTS